jgi:hypothetical protein
MQNSYDYLPPARKGWGVTYFGLIGSDLVLPPQNLSV